MLLYHPSVSQLHYNVLNLFISIISRICHQNDSGEEMHGPAVSSAHLSSLPNWDDWSCGNFPASLMEAAGWTAIQIPEWFETGISANTVDATWGVDNLLHCRMYISAKKSNRKPIVHSSKAAKQKNGEKRQPHFHLFSSKLVNIQQSSYPPFVCIFSKFAEVLSESKHMHKITHKKYIGIIWDDFPSQATVTTMISPPWSLARDPH